MLLLAVRIPVGALERWSRAGVRQFYYILPHLEFIKHDNNTTTDKLRTLELELN
jgi:hypothetical protein